MIEKSWFGKLVWESRVIRRGRAGTARPQLHLERLEGRDTPSATGAALVGASKGAIPLASYGSAGVAPTTTTMTENPAPFGAPAAMTFTATVTTAAMTPVAITGQVVFQDFGVVLGTAPLSGGTATFTASAVGAGPHHVTANYSGDSHFAVSVSQAWQQAVAPVPTWLKLTASSPAAGTPGQSFTFTAAVTTAGYSTPAPHTVPTGFVVFREGGVVLARVRLSGPTATLTLGKLSAGRHVLTAYYEGDAVFGRSPVAAVTVYVRTIT